MRLCIIKRVARDRGEAAFGGECFGVATGFAAHEERDFLEFGLGFGDGLGVDPGRAR